MMKPEDLPLIMDVKDVMKALNIGMTSAYELMKRKDFPVQQIGRQKRVNRDAFLEWTKGKAE